MNLKHNLINGLLSLAMLITATTLQAGQLELFTTGVTNPTAGFYTGTIGFGVSNNGIVAGTSNLGAANEAAFVFRTAGSGGVPSYNALSVPGRVLSISADGSKASGYAVTPGWSSGMVWTTAGQSVAQLDTLLGFTIGATISNNGQLAAGFGSSQMASWNSDGTGSTALGQVQGPGWVPAANFGWAGGVSDTGLVGGTSGYSGGVGNGARVAVIAQAGVANSTAQLGNGVLDGTIANPYGKVLGINSNGNVLIGESYVGSGTDVVSRGFIVDRTISDNLADMGTLAGFTQIRAQDLTNPIAGVGKAVVVGHAWDGSVARPDYTNMSAVIWMPGSGAQLLQNYAAANWGVSFPSGLRLATAWGISTDGKYITGSAIDSSGEQIGYLISTNIAPVPEPASIISLAVGGVMALGLRRRLKTRA
ncbi:MAG: PEP-CTERM sorting domain-containing protein [bacterium]